MASLGRCEAGNKPAGRTLEADKDFILGNAVITKGYCTRISKHARGSSLPLADTRFFAPGGCDFPFF
jgi:hypothetical protein